MPDQRATFAKVLIENGGDAKTIYSFRLERAHWIFGIFASLAAVVVALIVLRGAVYASVQDVAGEEFRKQLRIFHTQAQPAIRDLIDRRLEAHTIQVEASSAASRHRRELENGRHLSDIAETLARLDERLASIERRLDRQEASP
jgi:hypothetical protein